MPGTGPASAVIVRPKIFFLAFILLLFKVRLSVDGGEPTVIGWTDNVIPLPPGRHTLRCYLPYLFYRTMGDSSVEVEVPPNGSVRARWRTPWLVFLPGKWTVSAD